jgi:asparagine synthase (glutamine-hydrolysing)
MCGILGYHGPSHIVQGARLASALEEMSHRGPDGEGRWETQRNGRTTWLGHRRLAIIDLTETGRQPMNDPQGNVITFNGEIYNFRALREELSALGHAFTSQSDTEVILAAYQQWGPAGFGRLAGMFALALWDASRDQLVLARDPMGVKPLYWVHLPGGGTAFASEVRALMHAVDQPAILEPRAIEGYLAFGAVPSPLTLVRGIESLPPGTFAILDGQGRSAPQAFFSLAFAGAPAHPAAPDLGTLLRTVVRDHLESDVPVGVFLSGGVDSSSILALMRSEHAERPRSFSVVFDDAEFSEAPYSRAVAKRFETHHTEIPLSETDFLGALPGFLADLDQPSVDGANAYVISQVAHKAGVKVVLSGQGGDEVFAGYPTFLRMRQLSRFRPAVALVPAKLRGSLARRGARRRKIPSGRAKMWEILGSDLQTLTAYLLLRQIFPAEERRSLFAPTGVPGTRQGLPTEEWTRLREEIRGLDPINATSTLELQTYLRNMLLRDGDCVSMAHSIEVRVPFLDPRLVAAVASLPGSMKVRPNCPKPLLLDVTKDDLPSEVWNRKKTGFTFPWDRWLRNDLRAGVAKILDRPDAGVAIGLASGSCARIWRRFLERDPRVPWTWVWSLFTLVTWCEAHAMTAADHASRQAEAAA